MKKQRYRYFIAFYLFHPQRGCSHILTALKIKWREKFSRSTVRTGICLEGTPCLSNFYLKLKEDNFKRSFLQLISTWPRYGCRYYTVLDTDVISLFLLLKSYRLKMFQKSSCLLAVSNRGLSLYENKDSIKPNKVRLLLILN